MLKRIYLVSLFVSLITCGLYAGSTGGSSGSCGGCPDCYKTWEDYPFCTCIFDSDYCQTSGGGSSEPGGGAVLLAYPAVNLARIVGNGTPIRVVV